MSGHHPAHTRVPMGNPPPVEHGIGGWNHINHEAPGVGLHPVTFNPQQLNVLRGMVPQAHGGSAIPLHSSHPAWLNKVAGGSHNGDGSGLPPNAASGAPASVAAADQLFMHILANRESGLAPSAKYRSAPYQGDMIDLSRPAASLERSEPLPLLTGGDKESHASRNGSATSESALPLNGEVNMSGKGGPAVVSVIAPNPNTSPEKSVGRLENPVTSQEGSVNLNNKTDSEKSKAPTQHLKAAPVQTIVGHSKKMKSVEAIVENLFELGSKKQEADTTNSPGVTDWTSQNNGKPNTAQTVPKNDSYVSDHGEGEDSENKMRRKRKIDTPTRKSMSPPPAKKIGVEQGTKSVVSVNSDHSSQVLVDKPAPTMPPSIPTNVDKTPSTNPSGETNPTLSPTPTPTPVPTPTTAVTSSSSSVLASLEDDSHSTATATPSESAPSASPSAAASEVVPVKEEIPPPAPPAPSASSQSSVVPSSSECPVSALSEDTPKEDAKSAVVDVESKMEALFAGIIGSGDESAAGPSSDFRADLSNPLTPLNESLDLDTPSNIAAVLEAKPPSTKKGRPKGTRNGIRQSSDSIFGTSSTESTPQKGKKGKKKISQDGMFGESPSKKNKKLVVAGKKAKFLKEPSQQTCDSGSTVSSVRIRGPVVHCVGPRDCPTHVSIINAPARDDEDQEKGKKSSTGRRKLIQNEGPKQVESGPVRGLGHLQERALRPLNGKITSSGLCSSTLVTRGELDHPQIPHLWVCVFCKMGPHVNSAGDLFGPYLIGSNDSEGDHDTSETKKGKHCAMNSPPGSQLGILPVTPSLGEETHYIVWFHEDCAIWASGVYLVGPRLAGLDEAVWAALSTKCDRCRHYGANLGCLHHSCPQRAHYRCAQDSGWHLNEELFKCTCSFHTLKSETN